MPPDEHTPSAPSWTPAAAEDRLASSQLATLAVLAVGVAALYFGRDILIPVALAALLSFALEPLATRLRRLGVPRTAAVVLVVMLALVILGGVTFAVGRSVVQLLGNLPVYQQNIEHKIESLRRGPAGGNVIEKASSAIQHIEKQISKPTNEASTATPAPAAQEPVPVRVEPPAATPLRTLGDVATPFLGPLGTAGLVIVFLVFMLLEQEEIRDRFIRLAGRGDITVTTQALGEAAERVSRYLLMQLLVNATYGIPIGIGLWLVGVPNAFLWGLLAIVLRFIPYVGPFIAASFPIALAIAVDPGWSMVLWTLALFVAVELISNNVVEPWLYGHSTGLSTVAIIVAAIFWTTLWGPAGLLLSTPLTVCLVVLGRHVPQLRFLDVLLGSAPALKPAERFYQRMLAGDTAEGEEIAAASLAEGGPGRFCDEVALPALRLAEHDRRRDTLSPDRVDAVATNVQLVIESLPGNDADEAEPDEDAGTAPVHSPVLCVGGRTPLDVAAAALLAQRLASAGVAARVTAWDALDDLALRHLEGEGVEALALVHLGPSGVAQARRSFRRMRRLTRVPRLVVLLDEQLPAPVTDEQVKALGASGAALSLDEAAGWIEARAGATAEAAMTPAPVPAHEAERLAELSRLGALDTPRDPTLDRITARLREALGTPVALVSLVDEKRQFWKAACGLPEPLDEAREAPRETSICGHVVAANDTLVIEDVLRDKRFAGNPFLREHGIRFYAGAPLRTRAGLAVGSLCVLDTRPRRISASERQMLGIIAEQVVQELEASTPARAEPRAAP